MPIHTTADGRRLLVLHGDLFDAVVQRARWLAIVGDRLHTATLHAQPLVERDARAHGASVLVARAIPEAQGQGRRQAISVDFECAVAAEAKRRGADGVVCGHIHKAEIREIDGILYCNDGDWVESLTALVETDRGELRIVRWHEVAAQVTQTLSATREGMTLAYIGRH